MLNAFTHFNEYSFTINGIPTILAALAILLLSLVVLIREHFSTVGKSFFLIGLTASIWFFCFTWMYWSDNASTALWWAKKAYWGVPFIPAAVYHFSTTVLHSKPHHRFTIWCVWILSFLFEALSLLISTSLIKTVHHYSWGYYPQYGWLGMPFLSFFTITIMVCLYYFWVDYQHSLSMTTHRTRMKLLFLAFSMAFLASVDFLPKYGIDIYPFGYLPIFVFMIIIAYVIMRLRLIDITPSFAANQILKTMADILIVCDTENKIRVVNDAACEMLEYHESELVGQPLDLLLDPAIEKRQAFYALLKNINQRNKEIFFLQNVQSLSLSS